MSKLMAFGIILMASGLSLGLSVHFRNVYQTKLKRQLIQELSIKVDSVERLIAAKDNLIQAQCGKIASFERLIAAYSNNVSVLELTANTYSNAVYRLIEERK